MDPKCAAVKLQTKNNANLLMGDDVQSFAAELGVEQKKVTIKRDNDYGAVKNLGVGSIVKE